MADSDLNTQTDVYEHLWLWKDLEWRAEEEKGKGE